ncbi:major facilitator superfamily domain-containing protein [Limtongia smithiae]|uniref:major facilitator superfamily domain-containing protein n=1 Tax=Limtongia smithiae TaxID=1125753 RepID=UPI0034CE131C
MTLNTNARAEERGTRPLSLASLNKEDASHSETGFNNITSEDLAEAAQKELDTIDPAERARIRRKFDYRVVPFGVLGYLVAYIDRSNAGNAKLLGLVDDLELTGNRFNIALSAFFVTYILFEVPSNVCCKYFGPKIWLPVIVFLFGLISMCIAFAKTYGDFVALRCLLGIAEAGIMPGIAYMLSTFYRRHELAARVGFYASFASLSGAFGGLLATGLHKIPQWGIINTWRNIFFFEGILTMISGVAIYFGLPDSPATAKFLTSEERAYAARIIELETLTSRHAKIKKINVIRSLSISNGILVVGEFCCLLTMNSLSLFVPTILTSMGYSSVRSQLMSVPPYAVATVICVAFTILSDKLKMRGLPLLGLLPMGMIGFILLLTVDTVGVKYFAIFLTMAPAFTGSPTIMAWALDNSAGPAVRALSGAIQAGFGSIGGILATWTYTTAQAPKYTRGHAINLGGFCVAFVAVSVAILYFRWENRQRDAGKRDHRIVNKTAEEINDLGHRHPAFRFTT